MSRKPKLNLALLVKLSSWPKGQKSQKMNKNGKSINKEEFINITIINREWDFICGQIHNKRMKIHFEKDVFSKSFLTAIYSKTKQQYLQSQKNNGENFLFDKTWNYEYIYSGKEING